MRTSLKRQGGKLESDDCDATGPRPSRHRRVYLTTGVVARHGATRGCSGCVGLGPHAEACRVRLEKALADERADPVGTGVRPITEPTAKSQEPAPAAQQEPASSSSGPAAQMPTQNFQKEQMDSPKELGAQKKQRAQKSVGKRDSNK